MATTLTYDALISLLNSIGYTNIKKLSNVSVAILTNDNRIKTIEGIVKKLHGAVYDPTPTPKSSIGLIRFKSFSITVKPASRQGTASAGVENEVMLVNFINSATKNGPMNVIFKGKNKTFEVVGCVKATSVGSDTSGRKKADVILWDKKQKQYPISIKKDNAEVWESADSYFSQEATRIIEKAVKNGTTKLEYYDTYFKIEPNIAVQATQQEKRDVVFGTDIEGKGCIVTKTFRTDSFKQIEDTIVIDCSHIITNISDVVGDKDVMFLIRNDKTRKSIKAYPGIRVLAAYAKRINPNVKVVNR
jgi:hypothetical protein